MELSPRRHVVSARNSSLRRGMTLLELTVVILVILTLVGVLFLGANAWKRGSDRSVCVLNLQRIQQAVRGLSNLYGYSPGSTVVDLQSRVIGVDEFLQEMPECPGGGDYDTLGDQVPPLGTLYARCSLEGDLGHLPEEMQDW